MTLIYSELTGRTDVESILAAHIEIGEEISKRKDATTAWQTDATFTNLRKITHQILHDGVRVDAVQRLSVRGVPYTLKTGAQGVDAANGSFIHDAANDTFYARPHMTKFDYCLQYNNGTGSWSEWTDEAASPATGDIAMRGSVGDILALMQTVEKPEYIELSFSDIPAGGTRVVEYSQGGGAYAALAVTAVLTGSSVSFTGQANHSFRFTAPADWATDSITAGGLTFIGRIIRFRVTAGYGATPGTGSVFIPAVNLDSEIVVAWYVSAVDNAGQRINGKSYEPRLSEDSDLSQQHIEANTDTDIPTFGANQPTDDGGVVVNNGDGFYDELIRQREFRGGYVTAYHGMNTHTEQMLWNEYRQMRTMKVSGVYRTDTQMRLGAANPLHMLDVSALRQFFTRTKYPNMDLAHEGKPIPMYWGNTRDLATGNTKQEDWARALPAFRMNQGTGSGPYTDQKWIWGCTMTNPETGYVHPFGAIESVHIKRASDQSIIEKLGPTHADWIALAGNIGIQFRNGFAIYDGDEVRVNIRGYLDDAAGTFTGSAGALITKPEDVLHSQAVCLAGLSTTMVDLASFTESGVTKQGVAGTCSIPTGYKDNVSVYVAGADETLLDIGNRLCIGMRAALPTNNSGQLAISLLTTTMTNTDVVLEGADIEGFEEELTLEYAVNRLTLGYCQKPATNTWAVSVSPQTLVVGDTTVIDRPAEAFGWGAKDVQLDSYMVTQSKADALNAVIYNWCKDGILKTSGTEIIGSALESLLGDRILITRSRQIGGNIRERKTWLLVADRNAQRKRVKWTVLRAA
jgi:hypothetical protein